MAQGKFTASPIPSDIATKINGLIDDIAGKAASSHNHSAANITNGTLEVARGGTGITTNPSMLTNLGSTNAASVFAASPRPGVTGTLPVANGGTGATTAAAARSNLGLDNIGINPTGTIIAYAANGDIPDGYLPCNGAAVSRTTYDNLFNVIGTLYGEGDGINTFNLPDLTDRFIEGSSTAGNVKDAGLPNITGAFRPTGSTPNTFSGAFYSSGAYSSYSHSGNSGNTTYNVNFDASRLDGVYGKSDTVQPPAVTMKYIVKY